MAAFTYSKNIELDTELNIFILKYLLVFKCFFCSTILFPLWDSENINLMYYEYS